MKQLIEFEYDRDLAVEYAHRWAYDRNPEYFNFRGIGGDCTNFVSQCIYAGAGVMNYTPVYGWYYIDANDRSASWTGVIYLYNFITANKGTGPFGYECDISEVMPGDFCQMKLTSNVFHHSAFIVSTGENPDYDNILVATHTRDSDYRPLSTFPFTDIRFIHIEGVRTFIDEE